MTWASIWYRKSFHWVALILLPLTGFFYCIVRLRYFLYQVGLLKSVQFPVPVIVVGNITVGGTGKTPLVIWLAQFLKAQGLRPGIVARGVGGKKQGSPLSVTPGSNVHLTGDEAVLLAKRSACPVFICIDRVAAVQALLANTDCNIVLTDDGLQHYRLARDIEIALVDGERGVGNRCLLPAGPLREPVSRLKNVDFLIYHGEKADHAFTMRLEGNALVSLVDKDHTKSLDDFAKAPCHAMAAIGNPKRFFTQLRKQGLQVIEHVFSDHYQFQAKDFCFADHAPIIMTEKDAVKCQAFADKRFWYLPVSAHIEGAFSQAFLEKLQFYRSQKHA